MDEEKIIDERKDKLVSFAKQRWLWTSVFLVLALILGIYIRSLPMQDHNSDVAGLQPGLWDYAENKWTLGPDLDPWLFTRIAKESVETGSIPKNDILRNVPLGFDNSYELQMVSYMVIFTHKIIGVFGYNDVILAAILMPVLFFALTIISFFLFVREVFVKDDEKEKTKANIIALIATFFMIVAPVFLSRTVAGIPEKESIAFFFLFLSFYLFLRAWKVKSIKYYLPLAILAGASSALMGLSWGGSLYVYLTISGATLIAFLLNKIGNKESFVYSAWIITAIIITLSFTKRYTLMSFSTSISSGLAVIVLLILIINFILVKFKLLDKTASKLKVPKNIASLIIAIVILIVGVFVVMGPSIIVEKYNAVYQTMIKPITGRWMITVAENRQPYYSEWASDFGPYIKQLPNLPIMLWMFFIGSVALLFATLYEKIDKKHAWILTGLYALFFFGLVFSRYQPHPSILDGENFLSRFIYFGSALLLAGGFIYFYFKYEKKGENRFEELNFKIIFLFVLLVLCLISARSAVRLIMVLGPIAPIFLSYFIVFSVEKFMKAKDETMKVVMGAIMVLIIILSAFTFYNYYGNIKSQAYSFVPSSYNVQWQYAMKWVRDETPKDAVFAHWWDYGYWLQSIGERATVTDGGNAKVFWNYLSGRYVLTGDNQEESLGFLYAHNVSYLLIDSSDIGKYGAFSSIGSDINYDRYSWIGTFVLNDKQTQETKNQTLLAYSGGIALDEDIVIEENEKQIILPSGSTGVGLIVVPINKGENNTESFGQPYIVVQYNGVIHKINMRYLSLDNKEFLDYKSGIEGCAFIFPSLTISGQQVGKNQLGAAMFISPRLLRGYLAQKYILDDPFKKFPDFEIAHVENAQLVENLKSQGMDLNEFVYFNGVQGPIKIWKVNYPKNMEINQTYLDTDPTKYISWAL
jgi:asparagine N-glycosylation enzyme membrane subunit Stt3